jgi:hypothetical protein
MPRRPSQSSLAGRRQPVAALVQGGFDSLVQGISQQPQHLRAPGQGSSQINGWSSPIDGLGKRQNTQFFDRVSSSTQTDFFMETIPVADGERYSLYVQPSSATTSIARVTLSGLPCNIDVHGTGLGTTTVSGETFITGAAGSYLTTTVNSSFNQKFVAINNGPLALLLNREKVVTMDASKSAGITEEALLFVQGVDYQVTYIVTVNGTALTGFTTPKATDAANQLSTETVAADLAGKIQSVSGFTVEVKNSVIYIKKASGASFEITVADGRANTLARVVKKSVNNFSQLPTFAKPGFKIKIDNDPSGSLDDYYVKFVGIGSGTDIQEGTWQETVAPDIEYRIDRATMPIVVYRAAKQVIFVGPADGAVRTMVVGGVTYTYTFPEWADRTAGDGTTVPNPSFVGHQIKDMTVFRGRLAVISGESCALTKTNNLFTFFNETSAQTLDTDPIDVRASSESRSDLAWMLPLEENLLLFSAMGQYQMRAVDGDVLSPTTAYVVRLSNIMMNTQLKPRLAGPNILFPTYQFGYTGFREYQFFASTGRRLGLNLGANNDIMNHVPRLIQGACTLMDVGESLDVMVCNDASNPKRLYVYKYLYQSGEGAIAKQQASWSEWTFDGDVRWLRFYDNELWLVMSYPDGTYSVVVNLQETVKAEEPVLLLDRAIQFPECNSDALSSNNVTATYSASTGLTTFTVPYTIRSKTAVVTRFDNAGVKGYELGSASSGNTIVCDKRGDWTSSKVTIGSAYEFSYEFTRAYKSTMNQARTKTIGELDGRLQIHTWSIHHYNSGYYTLDVELQNRGVQTHKFRATVLNVENNQLRDQGSALSTGVSTGSFRVPVKSKNTEATITVRSDNWLPVRLTGASWEGSYSNRAQKN